MMTLTVKSANKLKITQRAMERIMLGICLRDHIWTEEARAQIMVDDVV